MCWLEDCRLVLSDALMWEENEEYFNTYIWDIQEYVGEPSLPELPEDVRRKSGYISRANLLGFQDYPPVFAKLWDIDGDGVEELFTLHPYGYFDSYSWDGVESQKTNLESNVVYAKLIDMDRDGQEELLLLVDQGTYSFKVYSWDDTGIQSKELEYRFYRGDLGIYREKETGTTYVGYRSNVINDTRIELCSLTDACKYYIEDYGNEVVYGNGVEPILIIIDNEEERESAIREAEEYFYTQLDRFELIENINLSSYEWENSLSYTVEEVRKKMMER